MRAAGTAEGHVQELVSLDRSTVLLLLGARLAARDAGRACAVLSRAGVAGEGTAAFLAAIAVLRLGTRNTVCLQRPDAVYPSRDESLLVEAIAGLQRGAPWVAQRAIAEWLPPDLALRAVALLAKAAASFARAGLRPTSVAMPPPRSGLA